jgi:hypothetical protein
MSGSLRARWLSLQRQGLPPAVAGNVLAYSLGLTPTAAGWTDVELGRLVLLRWLVARGMIGGEADMPRFDHDGVGPIGMTVTGEAILTRDRSSGRVHRRVRIGKSATLLVDERCNTDQSGAYDVIDSTEGIEPDALCRWCFPEIEGAPV